MKIALLIPVYNAESFLRECLDSAIAAGREVEKLGHTFEIRCCNDGSKDASVKILEEYAAKEPRLHFTTQENAGVAAARNRLMDELPADVDAFAFLDSDDTIKPEMYAKLAEAFVRTGADIAECEWKHEEERVIDDMSVYILRATAPGRWINVINKLYRRSSVGSIRFPLGFAFEEDLYFNYCVHQAIKRKVLVPGSFYYYRPNPASATSTLNQRRYFAASTGRIKLSIGEFLNRGRIPAALEGAFRAELTKDAYRMCIRKNLKKNKDAALRKELFFAARDFFAEIERDYGFKPIGLNPIQRALYSSCRSGYYRLAMILSILT